MSAAAQEIKGSLVDPTHGPAVLIEFDVLYDQYADFVWRNARRLGIADAGLDDVVQDVFLIAHRKLSELVHAESLRAWMFGILIRVVRAHRRTLRRRDPRHRFGTEPLDPDELADPRARSPMSRLEHADAARMLHNVLSQLDYAKREVFVLAELEELTEREIAGVLAENLNTVHSRLRAAQKDFDRAVQRERAKDGWRLR